MNATTSTSAPVESTLPAGIGAITTMHFAIIAVIALLVVALLIAGIRRKRLRDQATRDVVRHAEEAGVPLAPAGSAERARQAAPPPVVAAPPAQIPAAQTPPAPTLVRAPVAAPPPAAAPPAPAEPLAPDPLQDEPIAAAAPLDAGPAVLAFDEPAAPVEPVTTPADGAVTQLKGLGPKVAARLGELGITTVGQLAALNDDQAAALDAELGAFRGRMARDRWIEQARLLAAGDRPGFEAVFGRL